MVLFTLKHLPIILLRMVWPKAVQILKSSIGKLSGSSTETRVMKFLLRYRVTPQTTTGVSPDELLNGRK